MSDERRTKQYQTVIPDAALSIIGLTVGETFLEQISMESIVDGFGQRFSYVFADADPARPMADFPIYSTYDKSPRAIKTELSKITGKVTDGDVYRVNKKGLEKFKELFRSFASDTEIPPSFFRRAMFRAVQYALVYHVLLKKCSKTLDDIDIAWGTRLVALHLRDAGRLLEGHGISKIEQWCRRAEEIRDRCNHEGKPFTARAVIRGINAIGNVSEAKAVMAVI